MKQAVDLKVRDLKEGKKRKHQVETDEMAIVPCLPHIVTVIAVDIVAPH